MISRHSHATSLRELARVSIKQPNPHVSISHQGVPWDIIKVHHQVTLAVDIMYVNKVPFLVTILRNLKFGTVEALTN